MADPYNPEDVQKYKPYFMPKQRPKVFGTPEGLASLEAERSGLASFLGVPDYDAQLDKSREDAKLQFYLQMAQRGFAAAGATPRRNESTVSTLSRELFSPLAGDASKLAGQFTKEKRAIDTAKKAGDRQIRLAALQNVQRRQDLAYKDDAEATVKARNLAMKMAGTNDKISNKYEFEDSSGNWVNKPVRVVYDGMGKFTGFKDLGGNAIDKEGVRVWRKAVTPPKPHISGVSNVYRTVKNPDGTVVDVPAPGTVRVTSPTGDSTKVMDGTTILNFGQNGNAKIIKPGSKSSLYQSADTKKAFATQELLDLFRLPNKVGTEITRNTYLPKGDAPGSLKAFSTFTVGGATFDPRQMGETVDGKFVRTYNPDNQTVRRGDKQYSLSGLTTDRNPLQSTGTPTDAYVYLPNNNGLYEGDPVVAQRVIEQIYDPATKRSNPVPAFYLGGKKLTDYRPVDDRNEAFKTVQPMGVTALNLEKLRNSNPALKDIKVGEEILVQEAPGKADTGASPLYRYVYQGKPVELDEKALTALSTGKPLELLVFTNITGKEQEIDLSAMGQGIRKIKSGSSVQLPRAVFASLKPETQDFFSSNNVRQARAVKEADIRALWKTVLKENPNSGAKDEPTTDEIGSLFARFRGSRSQSGLRDAIFNMQSYAGGVRTNPSDKTVVDSSDKEYSYAQAVENRLKEAKPRYEALYSKGRLATKWSSLSFIEKMAFSRIPRRGLDSQKVEKQFQGALKLLEDRKAKFENVTSDETTVFAAAVRSLILLKAVKKGGLLNQTGMLEGSFSKLGAQTFADYPIISSTESSQLNQVLTDVNSNLKTIASSEGVDGRPSNFRLQLQQSVLPEFTKPETENLKNLDTIISKLQVAIRSRFGEAIAADTVIPQSFVRMAAEAGIEVDSNQDKYPWINPRVSLAEAIPVTRENTLKAIGLLPFDIPRFQAMKVGTNLPKDTKGLTYRKVSDTHIQGVKNGKLVGKEYLFENTLGNNYQGRTGRLAK